MEISYTDVWKRVLVNRSGRPILEENEQITFFRDGVGLYQGKSKIVDRQDGRVYLTNKRVIYLDNEQDSMSVCVYLADVKRSEKVERFLRSSPKVKLHLKVVDKSQGSRVQEVDWVCNICSFNNHWRSMISLADVEPSDLPQCTSCGIRPSKSLLESFSNVQKDMPSKEASSEACPRCTFINHPSMKICEMCGSKLGSSGNAGDNPGPEDGEWLPEAEIKLEDEELYTNDKPYVKLSFRKGGEDRFYSLLVGTLDSLKWEALKTKGAISMNGTKLVTEEPKIVIKGGGISGLEQKGEELRKRNERVLSTSLEDLEQLMYKYQDLLKLSNSFGKLLTNRPLSQHQVPEFKIDRQSKSYHSELARHISEYLTNCELTKASSLIALQDLFANYNKNLILGQGFGAEPVSSDDFLKAIELFEPLNLPVHVEKYEISGLTVVKPKDHKDYSKFLEDFLRDRERDFKYQKIKNQLIFAQDSDNYLKEEFSYFKGSTLSEVSEFFNWTYNIASEELGSCVQKGTIVIDKDISGAFYFLNHFTDSENEDNQDIVDQVKNDLIHEQVRIKETLKAKFEEENKKNLINLHPDYMFGLDTVEDSQTRPKSDTNETNGSLKDMHGLKI